MKNGLKNRNNDGVFFSADFKLLQGELKKFLITNNSLIRIWLFFFPQQRSWSLKIKLISNEYSSRCIKKAYGMKRALYWQWLSTKTMFSLENIRALPIVLKRTTVCLSTRFNWKRQPQYTRTYVLLALQVTYGDFFSTKKMSPCYKVHKKKLLTSPVIM